MKNTQDTTGSHLSVEGKEFSEMYDRGYNEGYSDAFANLYNPKFDDTDYREGYDDGQTDASPLED